MDGYRLTEGEYKKGELTPDEMWKSFSWLFSASSKNDTSYKFIFLKSIMDSIDKKDEKGRISFDILFVEYTRLAWNLVLKYGLAQKAYAKDGRKSILENIIKRDYDSYCPFEDLFEHDKEKICHDVKLECKKYVVGALFGDTKGVLYSFNKKEEWIELNPVMESFIKENRSIIENLNYYKWAQFYKRVNENEKEEELRKYLEARTMRKYETVYRSILAQEFETDFSHDIVQQDASELFVVSDQLNEEGIISEEVEEELYKDFEHMRRYLNDPIQLISKLRREKEH